MFSSNLLQKVLENSISSLNTDDEATILTNDELQISIIGPLLWSPEYFIEEISSDENKDNEEELIDSHANETLVVTKNKKIVVSELHGNLNDELQRRKRKICPARMTATEVCSELSKANVSPHLLIAPHIYGESFGAAPHETQPFQVIVHPQVRL